MLFCLGVLAVVGVLWLAGYGFLLWFFDEHGGM